MKHEIRFPNLRERGTEGGDESRGKLPNEADRVDDHRSLELSRASARDASVEGRKEPIRDIGFLARQTVEERRLSRIGIARDRHLKRPAPPPPLDRTSRVDTVEISTKSRDPRS